MQIGRETYGISVLGLACSGSSAFAAVFLAFFFGGMVLWWRQEEEERALSTRSAHRRLTFARDQISVGHKLYIAS